MTKSDTVSAQSVLLNIDNNKSIIAHTCTITMVISVLENNVFINVLETDISFYACIYNI